MVCGKVSGNLEVIDVDDPVIAGEFQELCREHLGAEVFGTLPVVRTASGGAHVFYRCDRIEGNRKLAQRHDDDGIKTLIETRGEGGYVITVGSPPCCHPTGKSYELTQGDLTNIPAIAPEQRSVLFQIARSFNEYVEPSKVVTGPTEGAPVGKRPGDDFNERAEWGEILEPHGWARCGAAGETVHWRRPGKTGPDISATTNFGGSGFLYVFSTNGHPFEAERGYSKFVAYALLNHNGDFSMAAQQLASEGYGEQGTSFACFASFAWEGGPDPPEGWPELPGKAAEHGLAGDFVRLVSPHSEADPMALLVQFLVAFGNVIGRSAHFRVEDDLHYTNLDCVVVGETSKARKGTSWGRVMKAVESADAEWAANRIKTGLSSGEGLIHQVRDGASTSDTDKRLLVYEGEFSSVLKVIRREGNTLSAVMRSAWDTGSLSTLTKNSPANATGAHVSIVGHITRTELLRHLDATEYANGFGNRILWVCARRSKLLPKGGSLDEAALAPILQRLDKAIERQGRR